MESKNPLAEAESQEEFKEIWLKYVEPWKEKSRDGGEGELTAYLCRECGYEFARREAYRCPKCKSIVIVSREGEL